MAQVHREVDQVADLALGPLLGQLWVGAYRRDIGRQVPSPGGGPRASGLLSSVSSSTASSWNSRPSNLAALARSSYCMMTRWASDGKG